GAGQGIVQVIVESGESGADIAQTLYDAGVVASTQAFILEANQHAYASRLVPGYCGMQQVMTPAYAILALLDTDDRDLQRLTMPDGRTLETYYQRIADLTQYPIEEVRAAAEDTDALGLPPEANGNLEGWLFPSTYQFNPGVHPKDVLAQMVRTTIQ